MDKVVWTGRVERKVRRKHHVEISLRVEGKERTQTLWFPKDGTASMQHPVCLQLHALVKATVEPHPNGDDRTWSIHELELLECPSDPLAIKDVLKEPALWKTLEPYYGNQNASIDNKSVDEEKKEELSEDYAKANHAMVKRIVLRLQRREPTRARIRPPHISFKVMKQMEALEAQTDLVDIHSSLSSSDETGQNADTDNTALAATGWNLPETGDGRVLISGRHKLTRQEYLQIKKHPQIAWMRKRLQRFSMVEGRGAIRHIVDVGGGRGDLAIELALGLGPDTFVTVVDLNERSLQAGKAYADQCGVGDRMAWICKDFTEFVVETPERPVDMVVALHACGNLSDLALDFAIRCRASFLICPCCYSKMADQTAATKLAELSERPDLSRRGMHVVNSQRYWDIVSNHSYMVLLEEYSRTWSSRNMVLVGWPSSV